MPNPVHAGPSSNRKVGAGVFVSTSPRSTCPTSCQFRDKGGCYAENMPLRFHWNAVSEGKRGRPYEDFLAQVSSLRRGELWRHNQAGDLAGEGDRLDIPALKALVKANRGRRGFTYTHKPLDARGELAAVRAANKEGFTVNLSADSLHHADRLLAKKAGPVAAVLPSDHTAKLTRTPKGVKVLTCPAYTKGWDCKTCQLCAVADRKYVIGFPAHGGRKKAANIIATSTH